MTIWLIGSRRFGFPIFDGIGVHSKEEMRHSKRSMNEKSVYCHASHTFFRDLKGVNVGRVGLNFHGMSHDFCHINVENAFSIIQSCK